MLAEVRRLSPEARGLVMGETNMMRLRFWTWAMDVLTRLWLWGWKRWAAADGTVGDEPPYRGLMQ